MGKRRWFPASPLLIFVAFFCIAIADDAQAIDHKLLQIDLGKDIFAVNSKLDRDKDGLNDSLENVLANTWRPYVIFDEHENDRYACDNKHWLIRWTNVFCGTNVDDDSLRDIEPVTIFQVRLTDDRVEGPRQIDIKYVLLFRLDGGFRRDSWSDTYHYGDHPTGKYVLESHDGRNWTLKTISLWDGKGSKSATSDDISWIQPGGGQRPSPKLWLSAGKHHRYINPSECEDKKYSFLSKDEDCGGGVEKFVDLKPKGYFNNVGEYANHPSNNNRPFVTDLAPLGFPEEFVWESSWTCKCPTSFKSGPRTEPCFTGGVGKKWKADWAWCVITDPVYTLFDGAPSTFSAGGSVSSDLLNLIISVIL